MTDKPIKLTKRQKQIMVLLDAGKSNKVIARELDIADHTVKVHLWRMFNRIGVRSRLEAAKWWRDNQPTSKAHALRAAFDAACRMPDHLKTHGQLSNVEEFEHHRAAVLAMEGAPA
jgi:DNA-binding CsgD family transcriptional regulator